MATSHSLRPLRPHAATSPCYSRVRARAWDDIADVAACGRMVARPDDAGPSDGSSRGDGDDGFAVSDFPNKTRCCTAEPLRHLWYSGAARYFPARVRDNGDSPSRRLLQENGYACRRPRLKIQAGYRPARHTLPDPQDVDALWSKNSTAVSAPTISAPRAYGWDALR